MADLPTKAVRIEQAEVNRLPPGCYLYFLLLAGECVYVGSTRNLKNRLPVHRCYNGPFDEVYYMRVPLGDRLYLERQWRNKLKPRYNADCHRSVVNVAIADLPPEAITTTICDAPRCSCVYFLSISGRAFYVGRATKLRARLSAHKSKGVAFEAVHYLPCDTAALVATERAMRLRYGPAFEGNTDLTHRKGQA